MEDKTLLDLQDSQRISRVLIGAFVFGRLVGLVAMPFDGLRAYSDFINYFEVSRIPGLPFIQYWVEYPPLFPFLAELLVRVAGGREHIFMYLLALTLLLADAGNLWLFFRAARRLLPAVEATLSAAVYGLVLVVLPYGWWYLDPIAVFWTLLSLNLIIDRRWSLTGLVAGIGIITKFFPGLVLAAGWRRASWKQLWMMFGISLIPVVVSYGLLWWSSPDFTLASLSSQASKGSWETVWALIDGNIFTGIFGSFDERLDPAAASHLLGNPPVIPPLASLVVFAGIGLVGLLRVKAPDTRQAISLVGFAWSLFLLWSPGWSPQWVLYLLPLILLTLPLRQAVLFGCVLLTNSLLEWPVLLSRGFFSYLWVPVVLRTLVLVLLCFTWAKTMLVGRGQSLADSDMRRK